MSERLTVDSREALAKALGHFPQFNDSRNLGYYRTEVDCSCGGTFWFGTHEGDPKPDEAWGYHLADALIASGTVRVSSVPVVAREALDQALFSASHDLQLGLRDSEVNPLADALIASGTVRPMPDEETVALVIRGVKDWPNEPWAKQREQARAVLALFEQGGNE